jgi:plastocyanin
MRRLGLGILAVAMAVLAGCSGEAAATSSPVATTSVDLPKSYRFEPSMISVDTGATVTWTNHDDFTHNVTFEGEPGLVMKPGDSVTRTFSSPGTFTYVCSLHPRDMQGSVSVAGG